MFEVPSIAQFVSVNINLRKLNERLTELLAENEALKKANIIIAKKYKERFPHLSGFLYQVVDSSEQGRLRRLRDQLSERLTDVIAERDELKKELRAIRKLVLWGE